MPPQTHATAGKTALQLLDELLPVVQPAQIELHERAAIVEVSDPAQLVELVADPIFRPFLLCRLSPTIALVDPGQAHSLAEVLRKRGYTPKVVQP